MGSMPVVLTVNCAVRCAMVSLAATVTVTAVVPVLTTLSHEASAVCMVTVHSTLLLTESVRVSPAALKFSRVLGETVRAGTTGGFSSSNS